MMKRIPEPEISSSVFHATLVGGNFTLDVRFLVRQSHIHGGSLVESVPKLELSSPEVVTLPQGNSSLTCPMVSLCLGDREKIHSCP
ncbi:hypothetical protein AVEN_232505-1 [Araneus ventricosus]|uniref:Uncharacterized protein n=1 Tax=Araneus ventricosus TaxID=182803 RepID=A0A4Y2TWX9_ARAVE|nr:hypothetical protein AVEN_232505-1 [Araneus ventricosus]